MKTQLTSFQSKLILFNYKSNRFTPNSILRKDNCIFDMPLDNILTNTFTII